MIFHQLYISSLAFHNSLNSKSVGIISAIIGGIVVIGIAAFVMQDTPLNEAISESQFDNHSITPMISNQSDDGKQFSISLQDGITTESSP